MVPKESTCFPCSQKIPPKCLDSLKLLSMEKFSVICSVGSFLIAGLQETSPNAEPINGSKWKQGKYVFIYLFNFGTLLEVLAMMKRTRQYVQNNATKETI